MIPTRRLLAAVGVVSALALLAGMWPSLMPLAWGALLLLAVLASFDALSDRLRWSRHPVWTLTRELAGVWPVGQWGEVRLTLRHTAGRAVTLILFDGHPGDWESKGLPARLRLLPGQRITLRYALRPPARGPAVFSATQIQRETPLGLWAMCETAGAVQSVRVFPDFSRRFGHQLLATDRRTPQLGLLKKRRRGEGTEFRQLREYREGDTLRAIDWKATARQLKPISREYQEERDQQVVFLLDCGRRMLAMDEGSSHFDHALDAVLALAMVAHKQGDAVGLASFGGSRRWLAPAKGRTGLDRLIAGLYDLQASEDAPDYLEAARALGQRLRRRAFIVLVTSLRDEDDTALKDAVRLLRQRHLILVASLREAALDAVCATPVAGFPAALQLAATEHYLAERAAALRTLGLPPRTLIDVVPRRLAPALVDRYLDLKESGAF
jgi:uncharacterized protein (DUF58 family)